MYIYVSILSLSISISRSIYLPLSLIYSDPTKSRLWSFEVVMSLTRGCSAEESQTFPVQVPK